MSTLTDQELDQLLRALVFDDEPEEAALKQAADHILDWASNVRIDFHLLELVLAGELEIVMPPNDGELRYRLTDKGRQRVEQEILPKLRRRR